MKPVGVIITVPQHSKPHLFPHDNVEASTGLVGEHNACVVIISVGIHIKCHTEVYRAELVVSCLNEGILVLCPNNCFYHIYSFLYLIRPKAMPGSELAVCRSSVPWLRITHKGSDCVVPLGSNRTTWNFLKSVDPISWFNGQGSSASGILSLSKSSKHASPLPSPATERNKERECNHVVSFLPRWGEKPEKW